MNKKEPKVPTSIKLESDIFEEGKILAKESARSFSQYVEYLIRLDIKLKNSLKNK